MPQTTSLKPSVSMAIAEAYLDGRDLAIQETDLPDETFPIDCPYEFEDILDAAFFPE
jgi:Domain of unknown function DUF29